MSASRELQLAGPAMACGPGTPADALEPVAAGPFLRGCGVESAAIGAHAGRPRPSAP